VGVSALSSAALCAAQRFWALPVACCMLHVACGARTGVWRARGISAVFALWGSAILGALGIDVTRWKFWNTSVDPNSIRLLTHNNSVRTHALVMCVGTRKCEGVCLRGGNAEQ
jgi:hypothetical protein